MATKNILIIILCSIIYSISFADTTYTVLINLTTLNAKGFTLNDIDTYIQGIKTHKQPYRTTYLHRINDEYALLTVTLKNEAERNYYKLLKYNDILTLIHEREVVRVYDKRLGGYVEKDIITIHNPMPEIKYEYEVIKSSE